MRWLRDWIWLNNILSMANTNLFNAIYLIEQKEGRMQMKSILSSENERKVIQ